jgi:hypothetical protein
MKSFSLLSARKGSIQVFEKNNANLQEEKIETFNLEENKNLQSRITKKFSRDEKFNEKINPSASPSRILKQNENLSSPNPKIKKANLRLRPVLSGRKGRSLEMSSSEIFTFCCNPSIKKKKKIVDLAYTRIRGRLQWLNFIKNQNDLDILKEVVLDKNQSDIIDLALLKKDHYSLYVRPIYNF